MAGGDRDKALDAALANIERQFGKGSVMRLGEETRAALEVIPTGAIALDVALGHRRSPARSRGGDLRSGVLGQDDGGAARGRQRPAGRRHRGVHRRRARARPGLRQGARGRHRRAAGLAARLGGAGAGDRGHAGPLRGARPHRHRLGRRAGAPRRDRGRDGRQPRRPAGPADEPGAAQDDRCPQRRRHHDDLHQPAAREDRRDVRLPRDDHRWPRAEVLRLGPPRRAPHRDAQGRPGDGRQPDPHQGREEQGRPAVQAGRVRHHVRPGHQPRGWPDRRGRRRGAGPQGRRLVHLRGRPARPGQGELPHLPAGQPRPRQRAGEEDPREARVGPQVDEEQVVALPEPTGIDF